MLQLNNASPFAASTALFPNEEAVDTLYVIVKATFNIGKAITLTDEQPKPVIEDVYWTESGKSSLKYASDMHIGKPATDIVMLGHACAPQQTEVKELDVRLSVGTLAKTVRVIGDRVWRDGKITAPASFKTLPLVYEKAFGGAHIIDNQIDSVEPRNPVGTGFAGKRTPNEMNGLPLPNLEDPAQLIRAYTDTPTPAGFGFCAAHWDPRASYAGTYDDMWKKTRRPFLPADFDKRFLNMAHPDWIYPGFLQGGEPVEITGMHPAGPIQFDLPQVRLVARIDIAKRQELPPFNLETVILEPNQLKVSMVWRAALPCDKEVLKIADVDIRLSR